MKANRRLRRKVRHSYFISTVSLALVLFLLGSVGYLVYRAVGASRALAGHVVLTVELREGVGEREREAVGQQLRGKELVAQAQLSTREEKAADEEFRALVGDDFEEMLGENPLMDSYEVQLREGASDTERLEALLKEVEAMRGVDRVVYPRGLAAEVNRTIHRIQWALFVFGGALLAVSLILLSNTIRLAIYARRYLINTMKLVGATKWFIMRPFLAGSIAQGMWAGLLASALFACAVLAVGRTLPELGRADGVLLGSIMGALVVAGIAVSLLFTTVSVNRFVNMKSNKIHLY